MTIIQQEIKQNFAVNYSFPVIFTRGGFNPENPTLKNLLTTEGEKRHRIMVVLDSGVIDANKSLVEKIDEYARTNADTVEVVGVPMVLEGGEACKNDQNLMAEIHSAIDRRHLCRQSFILAIGGGAVLDAVGYAAATAHRGIRLIRMPTTVLAQNDAGIGVKNSVNRFGKKNFLGTFAPPFAVVNDFEFLSGLPSRDIKSGMAEAIKVAVIKDLSFFNQLYVNRKYLAEFEISAVEQLIIGCAALHIEHIGKGGDPFEFGSARPLDFGHWGAHALEELAGAELRHGEAVAIGVALDSFYAMNLGLISEFELNKIITLLTDIGFNLYHWALRWLNIEKALQSFREHLGGKLNITLPNKIGQKIEVHKIDSKLMKYCIGLIAEKYGTTERRKNHVPLMSNVGQRNH